MVDIILVEPEIPMNTGSIARTCACTGARLHLIMPLGFDIYVRSEDWKMARDILESDDFETENIEELDGENLQEDIKEEDFDDIDDESYRKLEAKIAMGVAILIIFFIYLSVLAR